MGCSDWYFNPLPRKEGDDIADYLETIQENISIHSLVKRETSLQEFLDGGKDLISIHSLVKRETSQDGMVEDSDYISIHSLVKRETIQSG